MRVAFSKIPASPAEPSGDWLSSHLMWKSLLWFLFLFIFFFLQKDSSSFVLLPYSMHAKIFFNFNDDDQSPLLLLWRGPMMMMMMMMTTMVMLIMMTTTMVMIMMIKGPYCSAVERDWDPICKSLLFRLEDLQRNRLGKLKSFLSSFETTQRMMSISFQNLHKNYIIWLGLCRATNSFYQNWTRTTLLV